MIIMIVSKLSTSLFDINMPLLHLFTKEIIFFLSDSLQRALGDWFIQSLNQSQRRF